MREHKCNNSILTIASGRFALGWISGRETHFKRFVGFGWVRVQTAEARR